MIGSPVATCSAMAALATSPTTPVAGNFLDITNTWSPIGKREQPHSTVLLPLTHEITRYTAQISLGNPPQKLKVSIDTGGGKSWILGSAAGFCMPKKRAAGDNNLTMVCAGLPMSAGICKSSPQYLSSLDIGSLPRFSRHIQVKFLQSPK